MTTATKGLSQPANGSLVGVWDVPVNSNMTIIDNSFGGVATIALGAANVTLTAAQYQCAMIKLTGAISASIAIVFPALGGNWTIINDCTNQQSFVVYAYNGGTGTYIGLPPGVTDIMGDGTYMRYRSLPPIGSYMLLAGNGYQPWMTTGNPWWPYLNCDGGGIPGVYTQLIQMIGGNTPDLRGRMFVGTDQSTGRITSTIGSVYTHAGGTQFLPQHAHGITNQLSGYSVDDINHYHNFSAVLSRGPNPVVLGGGQPSGKDAEASNTAYASDTGFSLNAHRHYTNGGTDNAGSGPPNFGNMPPCIVGGLYFIRSGG